MKKISVFGGSGFIGSVFCNAYRQEAIKIPRNVRVPESHDVLYLISTTNNYNILKDSHIDVDTNLRVLLETLDECRKNNVHTFNFISSWFVYGNTELPACESSHCDPRGFYSITKRCAEQLIISYCKTFEMKYRILRLCNVYGKTDEKFSKKRNALQYLIEKIKDGKEIHLYDSGNFYRNFMHVTDVCRAMKLVCATGDIDSIYNIGSVNNHLFKTIIELVFKETQSKSNIMSIKPPEFHELVQVKDMILNTDKLRDLGFEELVSIDEGIKELCKT